MSETLSGLHALRPRRRPHLQGQVCVRVCVRVCVFVYVDLTEFYPG
jgi:hypothetical protein